MKTGDQVALLVKEAGKAPRWTLKELLIDGNGIVAITTPDTASGWPERLRLRPERLEESPMLLGRQALFFYQDDVARP